MDPISGSLPRNITVRVLREYPVYSAEYGLR